MGPHVAPTADDLPASVRGLMGAYDAGRFTLPRHVIAVVAAHHRFRWIHPFLDENCRVARPISHAMLLEVGIGAKRRVPSVVVTANSPDVSENFNSFEDLRCQEPAEWE